VSAELAIEPAKRGRVDLAFADRHDEEFRANLFGLGGTAGLKFDLRHLATSGRFPLFIADPLSR